MQPINFSGGEQYVPSLQELGQFESKMQSDKIYRQSTQLNMDQKKREMERMDRIRADVQELYKKTKDTEASMEGASAEDRAGAVRKVINEGKEALLAANPFAAEQLDPLFKMFDKMPDREVQATHAKIIQGLHQQSADFVSQGKLEQAEQAALAAEALQGKVGGIQTALDRNKPPKLTGTALARAWAAENPEEYKRQLEVEAAARGGEDVKLIDEKRKLELSQRAMELAFEDLDLGIIGLSNEQKLMLQRRAIELLDAGKGVLDVANTLRKEFVYDSKLFGDEVKKRGESEDQRLNDEFDELYN